MSYILTTMKTLRLIGTTLLMVMLAVNFTACSDDEDEQTIIEQANLIGKWQTTWEKIHKVENDKEVVTSDEAYTNGLWEFKADGTCTEGYADGGYTETSRWSLKDNKLTISYDDGYSDVLTVNELTATKLDCIKPYLLVGGTALSLQMGTRQSEDLDFMKWRTSKTEKMEVAWYQIEKELAAIGDTQHKNILDIDHVEYLVSGVKFSFYACPKYSPVSMPVEYLNNLRLADVKSIGAMKMEVLLRRSNFRDYYDIYSILKSGVPINDLVSLALTYSGHKLKSKNLLAMLTNGSRFTRDSHFEQLAPIYAVTAQEIEDYIKFCLL